MKRHLAFFLQNPSITRNSAEPFVAKIRLCKVVKEYDVDTITVAAQLYNGAFKPEVEMYYFNVRSRGIDTPEIKTKNAIDKSGQRYTLAYFESVSSTKRVLKVIQVAQYAEYPDILN